RLVRTRAIQDDVAVAWNLMMTSLHFIQRHVPRRANEQRIAFDIRQRSHIENNGILSRFEHLVQFIYGDSRHSQFAQELVPSEKLVADVKRQQADDNSKRAAAQTLKRGYDLFQLIAEQNTDADKNCRVQ